MDTLATNVRETADEVRAKSANAVGTAKEAAQNLTSTTRDAAHRANRVLEKNVTSRERWDSGMGAARWCHWTGTGGRRPCPGRTMPGQFTCGTGFAGGLARRPTSACRHLPTPMPHWIEHHTSPSHPRIPSRRMEQERRLRYESRPFWRFWGE